ncbi:BZ3500_MvSof-1268-A1-R1_Chr2-1g04545 [Microbotryum saponariae]|uniref:BZ3500_MvSof-1268-A1-R1_Chr2-1g04545 protein n=1 Tax=Microbotryum saponariae TaxID=289078 RepID=A0A2X0KD82_9BASI|nr:BZ3500_MvSof-1268-A1-R1_Chr2-1g04545 [Microbotryum saponariae]SCZ91981.1 BZ3501_MvSof-1269-A2-R1_Chr2-1g04201 [Microbotryum saponariae]
MLSLWSAARQLLYFTIAILLAWTTIFSASFIGRSEAVFGYHWNSASLLLSSSVIGNIFIALHFVVHANNNESFSASLFFETLGVWILWVLFLVGASDLSGDFPSGSVCIRHICAFARLTLAFAWVTWFMLSWLLFNLFVAGITHGVRIENHTAAWRAPYKVYLRGSDPEQLTPNEAPTPLSVSAPLEAGQPAAAAIAHPTAPIPMTEV